MNVIARLAMHDFALGMPIARVTSASCAEFARDDGVGATWAPQVSVDAVRRTRRDATVRKTRTTSHVEKLIESLGYKRRRS